MRRWIVLWAVFLLLPTLAFADVSTTTSSGATVTYSQNVQTTCTANSTMNGSLCYCDAGFVVSGSSCVKDPQMPAGPTDIYDDIRMEVAFNDDMTCAQLGIVLPTDLDMCQRFKATPDADKANWKSIPRPETTGPVIANPWAPASQQIMINASGTQALPPIIPPAPPPAPPPPPPEATTTPPADPPAPPPDPTPPPPPPDPPPPPETTPPPADTAPSPDDASSPAAAALAQIANAQTGQNSPATPDTSNNPQFSQIASADASQNSVDMSSVMSGLSLIPATDPSPAPEPTPTPPPADSPSFFQRIFGWIFRIF